MVLALCARVVGSASAAYYEDSSEDLLLHIVEPSPNENRLPGMNLLEKEHRGPTSVEGTRVAWAAEDGLCNQQ